MSFSEYLQKDRRLVILRALNDEMDATLNESLLQRSLDLYGHKASRTAVKALIRWLQQAGAVTVREVDGYLIATLTETGADHVARRAVIDGIALPALGGK